MSNELIDLVLGLEPAQAAVIVSQLDDAERVALWRSIEDRERNPYYQYRHDALGFVTRGLRESVWSKQAEVLDALHQHRRVVVAASHSTGKSHIASRAAGAVALSWPADMVRVQTTATNFRQFKGILWPYINRMHRQYTLPGEVWTTSWKFGPEEVGAGFSASPNNKAAVSGFHASGELLLVVDEGGGIHPVLGAAFNNILTGTGHALVIGNFPTDSDDTWFNRIWESPQWHQIRISAFDTPNFPRPGGVSLTNLAEVDRWLAYAEKHPDDPLVQGMYEQVGPCTTCPPTIAPHTIAAHLTDLEWVRSIAAEFGEESSYYITRVMAQPAKDLVDKALPMTWLEAVMVSSSEPAAPAPVKLGADIAADGGDEFVIAWMTGWRARIAFKRAGAANQNVMDVVAVLLQHVLEAERYHRAHGIQVPVRVKIDAIGIGRGVSDRLIQMRTEVNPDTGQPYHSAVIVPVESSRKAHDTGRFKNQRSEMWWTVRGLIQPDPKTGESGLLEIERENDLQGARLLKQLNAPKWDTAAGGQIVVQPKSEVKADTGNSPDRADALLLVVYEPPEAEAATLDAAPLALSQTNYWSQP